MTSQNLKFYKFNSSANSKVTTAKAVEGAIIYLVDVRELWIGGSTPKLVIKGANDVTFANNILTLTHYDNNGTATTQTLDFSDVASVNATLKVFEKVYNMMGATNNQAGTAKELDYTGTTYLADLGGQNKPAKNLVNADKALDTAIKNLADTVGAMDVQINGTSIKNNGVANIAVEGTYNASTNKVATESTVKGAIEALDGSATIASKSGDVVTIKTGVTEADGVISNDSGTDIVLEEVAVTGAAADVSIADAEGHTDQTTVEGAIDEIYGKISALEGSFDVIKSTNAGNTPYGVTWEDDSTTPATTVTGTLQASANTFHKVYLVKKITTPTPAPTPEVNNTYTEYITTRTEDGQGGYNYGWEKLGDISVDLTGYVKSVTINGKTYTVDTNSTNITIVDLISSIVGEAAISGGDTNYVKVAANTVKNTTNGTNITTLSTTVKLEEAADALTKDSQATYADGHYVIEGGKLVSAVGKSSGDTYTIANNGLTTAADVAAYVESKTGEGISSLDANVESDDAAVAKVRVIEVDGKITDVQVTNVSAGVTYTQSTASTAPNLAAGSTTAAQAGGVTGADIAAIKNYVDDASTLRWEEYE